MTPEKLLTPEQAGELINLSAGTIRQKIEAGELRGKDIARKGSKLKHWRTTATWLCEWMEKEKDAPPPRKFGVLRPTKPASSRFFAGQRIEDSGVLGHRAN